MGPSLALIVVSILMFTTTSRSESLPCKLLSTPISKGHSFTQEQLSQYNDKLKVECELSKSYLKVSDTLMKKHNISIDRLTEYQAMRFVRRVNYEESKKNEIPIELTYQILRSSYLLPNSQKSSVIWDNWIKGISQLESVRRDVLQGQKFNFEDLKRIHVGFFQLSKENGDDAHIPDEGVVKPESDNDNYWWDFATEEEANRARQIVEQVNQHYDSLNLLPNFSNSDLNKVLDVRRTVKRQTVDRQGVVEYTFAIYSGDSRANKTHVLNILDFVDQMFTQARKNNHLFWNGKILTPGEVAYLAQKFYVGVHPFSEGNGRTSRFLQELILTVFDMPHGSSGDLMDNDVLSTFDEYYSAAIRSNIALITSVTKCLAQYDQQKIQDISKLNTSTLDYACRILKPMEDR